ncbi:MAG: 50S ribosomal protein L6 [Schleiferiaceae bacterium]|nr:50S ribosomal protein L6 [Schleiferiaceae bacterium]
MSRIGKAPITVPAGVEVSINDTLVKVKGKLGELQQELHPDITAKLEDGVLSFERPSDGKAHRELHGLYRSLCNNMIEGVANGFKKELELIGVGYRAASQGQMLEISVGYSHNIMLQLPNEITVEAISEKGKAPKIVLTSHDKQLLGMVAAKIRSFRKPEPYKGKGIKFVGEQIRRKAGKSASKK